MSTSTWSGLGGRWKWERTSVLDSLGDEGRSGRSIRDRCSWRRADDLAVLALLDHVRRPAGVREMTNSGVNIAVGTPIMCS
jgi:hypothetical protein